MKLAPIVSLVFVACAPAPDKPAAKPHWPLQLRTTPSLCYLSKANDYHVLVTPLIIHDPIPITEPDWPGQTFWSTEVEWRVDAVVRGAAPGPGRLVSTHFIGPFSSRAQRVIGVKVRGDRLFTDLDDDSSFVVAGGNLQRTGGRFADLAELTSELGKTAFNCEPTNMPTPDPSLMEFAPRAAMDAGTQAF